MPPRRRVANSIRENNHVMPKSTRGQWANESGIVDNNRNSDRKSQHATGLSTRGGKQRRSRGR